MTTPPRRPGVPDHAQYQGAVLKEYAQVQALIDNEQQYDARFHALAVITGYFAWTTTIDGQGYEMLGWSAYTGLPLAECQGNGWRKALHPVDNERLLQEWKQIKEELHVYETTLRIQYRDGHYSRCKIRTVPVTGTNNQVRELVWAAKDLNEQAFLEQDTLSASMPTQEEHLEARANLLALHEANRRMNEFLGIASHELRTPMTSLSLYLDRSVQLLKTRPPSDSTDIQKRDEILDKLQNMLTQAQIQLRRQHRLVNDLLDFSRIHNNWFNFQMTHCNLVAIVQEAIEEQSLLNPSRNIELQSNITEIIVVADADRLRQVVNNYLSNALKYSPEDKPIRVHVQKEAGAACVAVQDEGRGLSDEEQKLVWEQFYRTAHQGKKSRGTIGLGLGLHICRAIIEKHNGHVGVSSQPGVGSTFWFKIPYNS
jgi:signal transduction histidine kinase